MCSLGPHNILGFHKVLISLTLSLSLHDAQVLNCANAWHTIGTAHPVLHRNQMYSITTSGDALLAGCDIIVQHMHRQRNSACRMLLPMSHTILQSNSPCALVCSISTNLVQYLTDKLGYSLVNANTTVSTVQCLQ